MHLISSPSTTITSPMSLSFITRAASTIVSDAFTVRGSRVMISSTVLDIRAMYPGSV
jgi:hypothetical protein